MIKDKKISILGYVSTTNEYGEVEKEQQYLLKDIWAYVRQLSAKEAYERAQIQSEAEILFAVNFNEVLKDKSLIDYEIKFRDNTYQITGIDYYEFGKRDVKIYAKLKGNNHN